MHDLIIKGGTIIDGTGGRQSMQISLSTAVASRKSAASAPMLVVLSTPTNSSSARLHRSAYTHNDAQICWDPLVTCSSWHGVTSVIMGNCGVGLAPCKTAERDIAGGNLVHVEAMPYERSLTAASPRIGNPPPNI